MTNYKGGNMVGTYVLFAAGFAMLVAAIYIYSTKENNSFDKLLTTIQDTNADSKTATKKMTEAADLAAQRIGEFKQILDDRTGVLAAAFEKLEIEFKKVKTENEIMVVRQHSLEKEILKKSNNVNVHTTEPIQIEILHREAPKTHKPLLEKAGITHPHTELNQ